MFDKVTVKEFERDSDIEMYCEFQKALLHNFWTKEYENHIKENFKLNPGEDMFVAIIKGRIVGAVIVQFRGYVCYIERVDVLENYRSKSIGSKLIGILFERFGRGNLRFELLVAEDEKKAISFYQKLGFSVIGRLNNSYKMVLDKERKRAA